MKPDLLSLILNRITDASIKYPRSHNIFLGYGTAGIRNKESLLHHVMFRMGILAALRSKSTNATVGVMITASHNPVGDNGLKLIDPAGDMLTASWELHAAVIANVGDEDLCSAVQEVIRKEKVDMSVKSSVYLGRDTRQSGIEYSKALQFGVNSVDTDAHFVDCGVTTTPLLHYLVVCANNPQDFKEPYADCYYSQLSAAFRNIIALKPRTGAYLPSLLFDGANGVGADAVYEIAKRITAESLDIKIFNDGKSGGVLNHECGADFVKVEIRGPQNFPVEPLARCVSFDGDADRVIYFYYDNQKTFRMLDGDKIGVLFAQHLGELVRDSGISGLRFGLVQTAYANGSSTNYVQNQLGIPVCFARTGVKHLHHAAITNFDIGVYVEANGHGTVVFNKTAVDAITQAAEKGGSVAAIELSRFMQLINQYVGDALSDMLTVEAILHSRGWSIEDWDAIYTDFPNRLLKVYVEDRNSIEVRDDGPKVNVESPAGVQEKVDALTAKYKNGRSFFRPSGTEDIVRVFAEADTQENADLLGAEVCQLVYDFCKGVGTRPNLPSKVFS